MLILASASKARRHLLEKARISHQVMISGLNEKSIKRSEARDLVQSLATEKAQTVVSKILFNESKSTLINEVSAVLGCDSVFVFEGEVFGKPNNEHQAFERWKRMSSKEGHILTGHSLIQKDSCHDNEFKKITNQVISTQIQFSTLTEEEIISYVQTGEPMRCAGGFALEGQGGLFIKSINGCYSNVIGLSLPWLRNELSNN